MNLTDAQVERWRILWEEKQSNPESVTYHQQQDIRRLVAQQGLLALLRRFLGGEISIDELRQTYDARTRTDWDEFGLKGMSGAMFLNKLVKHLPDMAVLTAQLQTALRLPASTAEGMERMGAFSSFLADLIESGHVTKEQLQPARIAFFISSWWHLQDTETWPIYYLSGRRMIEAEGLYRPTGEPVKDYFAFRDCFLAFSSALNLASWQLEHLLAWREDEQRASRKVEQPAAAQIPEEGPPADHTQIQWLLARIGKRLGCRVWIAANDHNKEWEGQPLGDLSIRELPPLGLDPESQRIVSLIDVIWLKGKNQVAAAFEIEQTTSIYSGLLRMSDLVALSPNLSFPLYIVAPGDRLEKVRRELSRPTFQSLELHRRCGFFSFASLMEHSEAILRWASDPTAIADLAESVPDASS